MSLPQKSKYPGVSPNIAQQSRGPHTIQHRTQNPVQVSREDYRLQHPAYSLSRGGVGSAGGAHEMNKQALGSQPPPPGGLYLAQGPASLGQGPPQQAPQPQHPATMHVGQAYYQTRQPQQVQQGPPQPPNPQAAPPQGWLPLQVQVGPQQVGGGGGRGPPGGAGPPSLGRPPSLAQAAQLGLSPLSTPPGAPPQPPVATAAAFPGALMPNFANQAAGYAAPQHMPQQPIILGNCMPYASQRPGQFNPTAQYVYHQPYHVAAPQATQMYYNATQGVVSVSLPAGGAPPQVQAPRGQHAYQQGAPQLQPRQRHVLEIKDPETGRNVLDDLDAAPTETTPTASEQHTGASDIAGMFAAQVAAAASSSGPPPTKVSAPVLEPTPPPPPPVEEVSPAEEEVATSVDERREPQTSPPPAAAAVAAATVLPTEVRETEAAATQGIPTEAAESVAAPSASVEVPEVPACTGNAESAVLAADVMDTQNSAAVAAEGRTPVVVDEVAPVVTTAAAVTPATRKEAEETPAAAVPAKTLAAVAAPVDTARETSDGRESRKSAKKKKMKEWNKKGENKEGGDMDAFVDKEEQLAAQPSVAAAVAPEAPARTPTPPMRLSPAPPTTVPTPAAAAVAPAATGPTSPPAAETPPAALTQSTTPTSPDLTDSSAGEDEQHRKAVKIKNEENLRVSREAAAMTPAATDDGLEKGEVEAEEDVSEAPPSCPAEDIEDGEENEEVEEEEEEDSSKESGDAKAPVLKYSYREDQWSPLNPEGRKQYDRQFLLMLQGEPMSLKKPFGLPNLDVIKDTAMQHKLPDLPRGGPYQGGGQSSMGGGPGGGAMGRGAHPEHLFMPPYARNGVARPPPGAGGGGPGRRQSQPGRGGDKPKKVITLSSSLNQDVKLHAAQNAWKPSHKSAAEIADEEAASAEELYRRVRGILNKLTPQKFQSLVEQVRNLEINSEERLNKVIDLVFEKALDEPNFSVPYANMCKHLAMFEVPIANDPEGRMVNFRKLLLLKCQKEFEKDTSDDIRKAERLKKIEEATSEEEKAKMMEELLEDEKKSKRRSLGNIRFIGELYNLNMLTAPIMFDCLRRLINSNDEDSLECLCKLLITIGKELDSAAAKGAQGGKVNPKMQLDEYFRKMETIVKKREVSLRVVFMLQDVIDLRQRKWIPRRDENIPKTIDQIHEEAQREQVNEELMRDSMPRPKRGEDRRKGGRAGGGGGFEDGWNTVPSKKHVDFNKLKQISTKQTEMDTIQLGPGSRMSSWAKGSSGGGKSSSQEPEGRPPGATNRFSALADAPSFDSRRGAQRSTASSRESSRGRGGSQQQSPMPSMGARKTPSQSRDRDAALAAVKNITSSNAPSAAAAAAPASSHEPDVSSREDKSREPDMVLKGPANMDEDTLKNRTEALVDQFLCNSDLQDAVQNVVELASPGNVHQLVSTAIAHTLDRNPEARRLTGQLLKELLKRKVFSLDIFTKGLHEVLEYGEDMELDIPKVWEYVAELVSPLFLDLLALQYLRDATEPLRPIGRAGRLAACVLAFLAKTLGEATVVNMWRTAGLQWSHFLKPGEDAEAFAKANGVAFTLGGVPATPSAGSGAPSGRSDGGSAAPPPELESQLNFLIRTKGSPSHSIIEWIESNLGDAQTKPPFIRALVTAVAENAITLLGDGNAELKEDLIKTYSDLLQKYLAHDEERELQALYALQALVNRLEHPKGVLLKLFNAFYDCDLISEDAFHRWSKSDDLAEQEGKGVAMKSTTSFFTWLAETDADSNEEN